MKKLDQEEVDRQEKSCYENVPQFKEMRDLFSTVSADYYEDPTELIEWNRMVADLVEENGYPLLVEYYKGWAEYWSTFKKVG